METNKELLQECKLQLEYLNEKFGQTGTTNALIAKIDTALLCPIINSTASQQSKAIDDYEFNMHKHWKDEPKSDNDDYSGTIKHFQD